MGRKEVSKFDLYKYIKRTASDEYYFVNSNMLHNMKKI